MRYPDIFAAIEGITSAKGPFPVAEKVINGVPQRVLGGLPDSLRDYYAVAAAHGDKECLVDQNRRLSFADVQRQVATLGAALAKQYDVKKGDRVAIAPAGKHPTRDQRVDVGGALHHQQRAPQG